MCLNVGCRATSRRLWNAAFGIEIQGARSRDIRANDWPLSSSTPGFEKSDMSISTNDRMVLITGANRAIGLYNKPDREIRRAGDCCRMRRREGRGREASTSQND